MTYYNMNNIDIEHELDVLRTAYYDLRNAYVYGDRHRIKYELNKVANLQISGIRQDIRFETEKIINRNHPNALIDWVSPNLIPADQLGYNVQGYLNALQKHGEIRLRELYMHNDSFAQRVIFQSNHKFCSLDILDSNQKGELKVEDLLTVLKYACSIAEAISPENEDYARASATITVYQAIDAILNNRPAENKINGLLHLMVSFLSTKVKNSLNDPVAKQNVTLSAIVVDLAIDFFCKK